MEKNVTQLNKKNIVRFLVYLMFIGIAYFMFLFGYITSDYLPLTQSNDITESLKPDFAFHLVNGRWASYPIAVIVWLFAKIGITYLSNARVMQVIGMLVYALCACIVHKILAKNAEESNLISVDEVITNLCIVLMFVNPYITETYVYGSMVWAAGILLGCLSAYFWCCEKYILGFLFAFFTVSYYQADIFIPVIICITYYWIISLESNRYDVFCKKSLLTCVLYALVCVLSLTLSKVAMHFFASTEVVKNIEITQALSIEANIYNVFESIKLFLLTTSGFSPLYFSMLVVAVCLITGGVGIVLNGKSVASGIVSWCLFISILIFIPFSFGIIGADGGYPPRVILGVFFSLGAILLSTYRTIYNADGKKHIVSMMTAFIVMVVSVYYAYNAIGITDCYIQQAIDTREVHSIQKVIEEYENERGIEVTTILTCCDRAPLYRYPEQINYYYGTTYSHRMLRDTWSQGQYLNYMCGTNYKTKNFSEEKYKELFGDSNWDELNLDEQLYFEGDTLYWAVY